MGVVEIKTIENDILTWEQTDSNWKDDPCFGYTIGEAGCSLVSIAMCVKESPKQLCMDGFGEGVGIESWSKCAKHYGYKWDGSISKDLDSLYNALDEKRGGIILRVKSLNLISGEHFVVLYRFKGEVQKGHDEFTEDMFKVHDPMKRNDQSLSKYKIISVEGKAYKY